jgi:PAS domain S-box-containing protein
VNIYTLLQLIALLVNFCTIIYILSQKRNSRLDKSYIYYLFNISIWILIAIILKQIIPTAFDDIRAKLTSIFWLSIGIWFVNFSYEFVNKKKDWLFFSFITLSVVNIAITFTTGIVIRDSGIFNGGYKELFGPLFMPAFALANIIPGAYGLFLIVKKAIKSENIFIQRSAKLIITGTLLAISLLYFPKLIFPLDFQLADSIQLVKSISIIQTVFIFIAIFRSKLFGLGIEVLSYRIFSSMKDAVIITDREMIIIKTNDSAQEVFGINPAKIKGVHINEILPEINDFEEKEIESTTIKPDGEEKCILITIDRIVQNEENFGYIFYIKDITVRKIIEKGLIESEKSLSDLFDSSPDALIVVDRDGKIIKVNPEVQNLFGYSKEELIGKEISLLIPHRFRSTHDTKVESYKNNPRKRRMGDGLDLYGLKKDGSEFSVDIMLSPMTQREKKMTLCTVRDITNKKLIEQKLKDNEEHYRVIFQTHPHGIVETTLDGTITLANIAYAQLYEFEVEEIIGKKVWEVHDDKEFINNSEKYLEVSNDGTLIPQSFTSHRKTKTGKKIEVQIDWDYKRDGDDNPIGYIKVVTDITEKRKAERTLNQQRLMLAQAERLAHLGSWKYNIKTGKLFWSDELFRIYGEDKNTFEPSIEEYQKRLHPDDRTNVFRTIEMAINNGVSFSQIERIIRPDGEVRILSSSGVPQKSDSGEVIGLFGSCLDVTEYKKIERELLNSQKQLRALSANLQDTREEERTKLAREIHDEFGQILTAANMDVGLLISELVHKNNINKELFFYNLESIEGLIEKSIKTIQNIATELRLDVLDHLGLISALEWQLKEFENRYSIETKLEKSVENLEIEDNKKIALFRIFQEALTNVARHSKATKVTASLSKQNNTFEMRVIDNGIGIPEEKLDSIKSIGLIGIRERIVLLNGEVFIKTAPSKGTELHFKVPIK